MCSSLLKGNIRLHWMLRSFTLFSETGTVTNMQDKNELQLQSPTDASRTCGRRQGEGTLSDSVSNRASTSKSLLRYSHIRPYWLVFHATLSETHHQNLALALRWHSVEGVYHIMHDTTSAPPNCSHCHCNNKSGEKNRRGCCCMRGHGRS